MIEDYSFGRIVVDGAEYASDLIIYPDRVDDGWRREKGHKLKLKDLRDVLAAEPEVVVVGTGAHGIMRVSEKVRTRLAERGIELHAAKTAEACRIYNDLAPRRRMIAALHLTC